jgi:uncharacterized protein YegL
VTFFGVGFPGADMDVLAQFSRRPPVKLIDLRFREMIQWLSRSMRVVSQSNTHTGGDPFICHIQPNPGRPTGELESPTIARPSARMTDLNLASISSR